MPERTSALAAIPVSRTSNAAVSLGEVRHGSIVQVAAWPSSMEAVGVAVSDLLGVALPRIGSASGDPNVTMAAIGQGRLLIAAAAPDLAARLQAALPADAAAVTDLSHGRAVLRIEGERSAELLGRVAALDLHPAMFAVGAIAQTMIHHIDVLVHRSGTTQYDLWAPRSFAASLVEWILDAGVEIGTDFDRRAEEA